MFTARYELNIYVSFRMITGYATVCSHVLLQESENTLHFVTCLLFIRPCLVLPNTHYQCAETGSSLWTMEQGGSVAVINSNVLLVSKLISLGMKSYNDNY